MILDAALVLSTNQAVLGATVYSSVFDTAGLGVGQPATNLYGIQGTGSPVSYGQDIGGGGPLATAPQLGVFITQTFLGGTSLQLLLQEAADTNNTGTPGTWYSILESDTYPVASLIGNAARPLVSWTVPDRYLGQGFPRFYRVGYVPAGTFTAGLVSAAFLTGIDDVPFYGSRF